MEDEKTRQELLDLLARQVNRYLKHTWLWKVPDERETFNQLVEKYQGRQRIVTSPPTSEYPDTWYIDVTLDEARSIVSTALQHVNDW